MAAPSGGKSDPLSYSFTSGISDGTRAMEEKWLEEEILGEYLEYTDKQDVSIFIGTWNVNAKGPSVIGDRMSDYLLKFNSDDTCVPSAAERRDHIRKDTKGELPTIHPFDTASGSMGFGGAYRQTLDELADDAAVDDFIQRMDDELNKFTPDIYVLGFQEVVDLNATALVFDHTLNVDWENEVSRVLGGDKHYVCVASQTLVGILLLIYVRNEPELLANINNILIRTCGVGVFGTGGNKGAVSVRMNIYDSAVCFVCAHLAAHKGNVQGRNDNFMKIIETTKFPTNSATAPPLNALDSYQQIRTARRLAAASAGGGSSSSSSSSGSSSSSSAAASSAAATSSASSAIASGSGRPAPSDPAPKVMSPRKAHGVSSAPLSGDASLPGGSVLARTSDAGMSAVSRSVGKVGGSGSSSGGSDVKSPRGVGVSSPSAASASASSSLSGANLDIMRSHDMIFWFGDLNYRLNMPDLNLVYDLLRVDMEGRQRISDRSKPDYLSLLLNDQLTNERKARNAFAGFQEPPLLFPPTYKFDPGTDRYDRKPTGKLRFPAWCDRIMYAKGHLRRTTRLDDVHILKYASNTTLHPSDHRPVFSLLKYKANKFDLKKREAVRKIVYKKNDSWTNDSLPKIRYTEELNIFEVRFGEINAVHCLIENIGKGPFDFEIRFMPEAPKPLWLDTITHMGKKTRIFPGKKISVVFKVLVNADCVPEITRKYQNNMSCVAILTIGKEGIDKFITLNATYLPSCFGSRIEDLVHYRMPMRLLTASPSISIRTPTTTVDGVITTTTSTVSIPASKSPSTMEGQYTSILSIPKEVWRLIDFIYTNGGMQTQDIFVKRGSPHEFHIIRECLDTGKSLNKSLSMLAYGEAFVRLLESFEDPVLPLSLVESMDDVESSTDCRKLLMLLPLSHYNLFIYVVSFLKEVLKFNVINKLTVDKLSFQFASSLIHYQFPRGKDPRKLAPFVLIKHFLTSTD